MSSWRRILLLAGVAVLPPGSAPGDPAPACRCPERTLERYFAEADLVLVGRIVAARQMPAGPDLGEHIEVRVRSHFRAGGAYKGDITEMVFATPADPASCGVAVKVGEDYVIFATTTLQGNRQIGWFDRCSGSRRYPGANTPGSSLFLGRSARDAVVRLAELADGPADASPTSAFHTSPACWARPRLHHQGTLPDALQARVQVQRRVGGLPDREGLVAPNGAYVAWGGVKHAGDSSVVVVDVERPWHLRIVVSGVADPVTPRWITEKLLFFRAMQGRAQFTDVMVDVETGRPIYIEAVRDGTLAYEQFQQACLGQCPCNAEPGSADSVAVPPSSVGLPEEHAALVRLVVGGRASLDVDWDGRVFSAPGDTRFTRPALPGGRARRIHTVDLLEVRFVASGWWAHVAIYADEPCNRPLAIPVHAGWVPAFAPSGHLVLASGPERC
jgi:hypothetical protein